MDVLTHPNPALKERALPVDPATDAALRALVKRMAETMYAAPGVGLAATQIGVKKRVIVFDVDDGLHALCNPEIVDRSEETSIDDEGCLSLPGLSVPVERHTHVVCEGLGLDGEPLRIDAADMLARVLQHEIDHLEGMLIIDRASPAERKAAIRRYNEALAETAGQTAR